MKIIKSTLLVLALGVSFVYASEILATVNGKQITIEDAQRYIKATRPQQPYATLSDSDKKMVIEKLIERILLVEEAKKAKTDKNKEFKRELSIAKDELMISLWLKKQFDAMVISDSEAKEFYGKNIDQYKKPAQVHARHILLKDEQAAKKTIDELKGLKGNKLKEKFIKLAKNRSKGPSGSKGGDLGYFSKAQMVAPFSKAAFALKKGEITPKPVKTQFGYHVIFIEDKKNEAATPYAEVKEQIIQRLKRTEFKQMLKKRLNQMKQKALIKLNSDKQ